MLQAPVLAAASSAAGALASVFIVSLLAIERTGPGGLCGGGPLLMQVRP